MTNELNFKLIDGVFQPKEAQKLLFELINTKINFHNLDAFSNYIRFNTTLSNAESRTQELKNSLEEIILLVQTAKEQNLELEIHSNISISLKNV